MVYRLTRRRILSITACAALAPISAAAEVPTATWHGVSMGAATSLKLVGHSSDDAEEIFASVVAELSRLEDIFSLYRAGSALSRLNQRGKLLNPPAELIDLLENVDRIHQTTEGVFDPTVQSLWELYSLAARQGKLPKKVWISDALARTGWGKVGFDKKSVVFDDPSVSLTLNGIAQGYVTDQIGMLLQNRGFQDVFIDMGELRGLGYRPDGGSWRAGIAMPDGRLIATTEITNRALATSAPKGTILDPAGKVGHIFDPRDGSATALRTLVSVSANSATLADGLSTSFCMLSDDAIERALDNWPDAKLEKIV